MICRDLKVQAVPGSALMELSAGMKVARAVAECGGDTVSLRYFAAEVPQRLIQLRALAEVGYDSEVVSRRRLRQQLPQ